MQAVLRRIWSPNVKFSHQKFQAFPAKTLETGDENHDNLKAIFCKKHNLYRMPQCFVKKSPERTMPYTLVSNTNAHTIRGRPHLKMSSDFVTGRSTNSMYR